MTYHCADGDEADGFDEAICPVDYVENGVIVDDVRYLLGMSRQATPLTMQHDLDATQHSGAPAATGSSADGCD